VAPSSALPMRAARICVSLGLSAGIAWFPAPALEARPASPDDEEIELFSEPDLTTLPPDVAEPDVAQSDVAQSDAAQSDPEKRARASERFKAGQAAFAEQRYPVAAEAFEQAYALAPHHAALWNAARGRALAGQNRMAANHYHRFLDIAPSGAPGRTEAQQALEKLAPELAQLNITALGASRITVDGDPVDGGIYYVDAGLHHIVAHFPHGRSELTYLVRVGENAPLTLTGPSAPVPPKPGPLAPRASVDEPPPDSPSTEESSGWPPITVVLGTTATLALVGTGVWSAIDGQDANDAFSADASEANKKERNRVNFRTVTLFGIATAAGILTTAAAVWWVDWGSEEESTSLIVTPGGFALTGRF